MDAALATALERAAAAGEWSTVAVLAAELAGRRAARESARRHEGAEVLDLADERRRRDDGSAKR